MAVGGMPYMISNSKSVPVSKSISSGKPVNSIQLYNIAAKQMNTGIGSKINAKPPYVNSDLTKPSVIRDQYYKDYASAFSTEINKAANNAFGAITTMRYSVEVTSGENGLPGFQINQVMLKHTGASCKVVLTRDSKGFITNVNVIENVLKQEVSSMNELAHFGTKGMTWGVRQGKKKTGFNRKQGAVLDRNARTADTLNKARSGEAHRRTVALGKKIIGENQWEKNFQTSMKNINAQNERVKSGKATLADKIDMTLNISALDRVISRTPR